MSGWACVCLAQTQETRSVKIAPQVEMHFRWITPGSFLMGSPPDEEGRNDAEGPQHRVTLARGFALGIHEVTVEQFARFVGEARFRTEADTVGSSRVYDERSGRIAERERINWSHDYQGKTALPNDPVLHVDWYDAQAYVEWL